MASTLFAGVRVAYHRPVFLLGSSLPADAGHSGRQHGWSGFRFIPALWRYLARRLIACEDHGRDQQLCLR